MSGTELRVAGTVTAPGEVRCEGAAGCPRCARGEGCGQAAWFSRRQAAISLSLPTGSLAVAAPVVLRLPASRLLWAAWLAYGLPLAGLLLGALAGHLLAGDRGAVPAAAAGLLASVALARVLARNTSSTLLPDLEPGLRP